MQPTLTPDLLRRARRLEDLTQLALAQRAGIAYWRYIRLERGIARPRTDEVRALLEAMPMLAQVLKERRAC